MIRVPRWTGRAIGIWLGARSGREQAREVRVRPWVVITSVVAVTLALATILAVILVTRTKAPVTPAGPQGSGPLAAVASAMPKLTPAVVDHGLSHASTVQLAAAVRRGQRQDVLSSMTIWGAGGQVIYSSAGASAGALGTRTLRRELIGVLGGRPVTPAEASALDLTSRQRAGTVEAFQPLRTANGRVFAAVEVDAPLRPILSQSGQARRAILIFVAGSLVVLWLLFLPLLTRAAVGILRSERPRRRRTRSPETSSPSRSPSRRSCATPPARNGHYGT